jgi:hypothetical protein
MLAAAGCPEMPMFNESCIVRHTDIRKPHEKPGAEKGCEPNAKKLRCRVRLPAIPWPNRPVGANLVQTMDPR